MNKAHNNIILFDGDCSLCNNTVQFIIKHDPNKIYKFASLQSDFATEVSYRFAL
jgi:predicted DCC family thiol-disulfide oxidoreductase YuxK